jgi:YHS domain-containing protein
MRSPFRQSLINEVNSLICPTCGCSLVRLEITPVRSLSFRHEGIEYFFCCAGCRDLFIHEPRRYLQETDSLEVCLVCLAEKPKAHTVRAEYAGRVFHFCRCPQCLEEFHRRPAYYIDRLEDRREYAGIFGDERPCCAPSLLSSVVLQSLVTCPNCGNQAQETMPTDACLFFYECPGCHAILRPRSGDCCVFCSYGSIPCPSAQTQEEPRPT